MIHLIVLCKLNNDVDAPTLKSMAREARSQLLKIPMVLGARAGYDLDPKTEWPFYYSVEVESLQMLSLFEADPIQIRFAAKCIKPHTWTQIEFRYELEPSKDIRFS